MNAFGELKAAFRSVQASFLQSAGLRRVQEGRIGVAHYAGYQRQVFHHTR
jgi:hypothetical protein